MSLELSSSFWEFGEEDVKELLYQLNELEPKITKNSYGIFTATYAINGYLEIDFDDKGNYIGLSFYLPLEDEQKERIKDLFEQTLFNKIRLNTVF
jgi:hypothetical protein